MIATAMKEKVPLQKANSTANTRKLKKMLEDKGYTNVHVWRENAEPAYKFYSSPKGFFCHTDQQSIRHIGKSMNEALKTVEKSLDVRDLF